MRDYYSEYLEKKAKNVLVYEVSKVSKAPFGVDTPPFDTFDTKQIGINPDNFCADIMEAIDFDQKNAETLCETQSMRMTERLSAMIQLGAAFEIGLKRLEITGADLLKQSERDFLSINKDSILCILQQSLLMKHIFNQNDHLFSDFVFEIAERLTIMSEHSSASSYEIYFEAVSQVTENWFVRLL